MIERPATGTEIDDSHAAFAATSQDGKELLLLATLRFWRFTGP